MQVAARYGAAKVRGSDAESKWNALFAEYEKAHPELATELKRRMAGELPANWQNALPRFTPKDSAQATRSVPRLPEWREGWAGTWPSRGTRTPRARAHTP